MVKFGYVPWMLFNFGVGYGHEKIIENHPEIAVHPLVNNIVIPLFPSISMTLRNAIVDKEELSSRVVTDPINKKGYSVSGRDIYLENLTFNGLTNFVTSYVPYVAGRLVAKVI